MSTGSDIADQVVEAAKLASTRNVRKVLAALLESEITLPADALFRVMQKVVDDGLSGQVRVSEFITIHLDSLTTEV